MWHELYYTQHTDILSKGSEVEDINVGYATKLLFIPNIRCLEMFTNKYLIATLNCFNQ